jgi:hypothetical protein
MNGKKLLKRQNIASCYTLLFCLANVFVIFPLQVAHKGKLKDSQEIACL